MRQIEREILFDLIRLSLGTGDSSFEIPYDINWDELAECVKEQGVAALAFDGFQKYYESHPNAGMKIDEIKYENLKYEWFSYVMLSESECAANKKLVHKLLKSLKDAGLEITLMKGFSLSKYWPNPSMRPPGDLDIVCDNPDAGDELMRSKFNLDVRYSHGAKHSHALFRGMYIENHRTYLDEKNDRVGEKTNAMLDKLIRHDGLARNAEFSCYELPPVANYVFMLRHLSKHFLTDESVCLRQLLDFVLFIREERNNMDISRLKDCLNTLDMNLVNDVFLSVAQKVSGFSFPEFLTGSPVSDADVDAVLSDILRRKKQLPENRLLAAPIRLRNMLALRWKYRYVPDRFVERLLHPSILMKN